MVRLLAAAVIALTSLFTYCSSGSTNPVTGEHQKIGISYQQEVALGRRALPELLEQYHGLHESVEAQDQVDSVGKKLVGSLATDLPYEFEFHLLRDPEVVNAFALPGGQICLTGALYQKLESHDQLAAILSHEIGHVVARHSAEQLAKRQLANGLTGAAIVATFDPKSSTDSARMAMVLGELVQMKFSREDEMESDLLGLNLLISAGYEPEAMLEVMAILEKSGPGGRPDFISTHPSPKNRTKKIKEAIGALSTESP